MSEMLSGFGYKNAWLAFRDVTQEQAREALGLEAVETVDWPTAVDGLYERGRTLVTPPVEGADATTWVLAINPSLPELDIDVAGLSADCSTEVQYFHSHRVSDDHGWSRADSGTLLREFACSGEQGAVLTWFGRPDTTELSFDLPDVEHADRAVSETVMFELDPGVSEETVMSLAGSWSIDPDEFEHLTVTGDPLIGDLPRRRRGLSGIVGRWRRRRGTGA